MGTQLQRKNDEFCRNEVENGESKMNAIQSKGFCISISLFICFKNLLTSITLQMNSMCFDSMWCARVSVSSIYGSNFRNDENENSLMKINRVQCYLMQSILDCMRIKGIFHIGITENQKILCKQYSWPSIAAKEQQKSSNNDSNSN